MGTVAFALLLVGLLWLAVQDAKTFCLAVFAFAGLPMEAVTGGARFLSGPLEVDAQALYMFVVLAGTSTAFAMRTGKAVRVLTLVPPAIAFLVLAFVSLAWADSAVYGLRMFVKLLTPLMFMWLVALVAGEGLSPRRVALAIYASAALLVGLALVNVVSGGALGPLSEVAGIGGLRTLAAPYTSPSNFSFALSIAALLAFGQWAGRRRPVYLLLGGAIVVAVVFALCRAAIAGLLVGYVVFSMAGRRGSGRRFIVAAVAALAIAASLFSVPEFRQRMFFEPDSVSWSSVLKNPASILDHLDTSGRDGLWAAAREDFRDSSAWLGSGIGSVDRWIRDRDVRGSELHSDFFRLYLDLGVAGLATFVLMLLSIARGLLRKLRRYRMPAPLPVERVALAALACYATTLPTDNSLNYVANFAVLVFGLIGLGLAPARAIEPSEAADAAVPRLRRFQNVLD